MYDYKFRQGDLSLEKPRRNVSKLLLRATALIVVAAAVYAILDLGLPGKSTPTYAAPESDVIPLSLPPKKNGSQRDPL